MTNVSRAARVVRQRFPLAYWRVRQAIALGEWCWHRTRSRPAGVDAYDDEFWERHADPDWVRFAEIVLRLYAPRSVVDIGCGQGLALAGFAAASPGMRVRGFDDSPAALARAAARGIVVERFDAAGAPRDVQQRVAARVATFDLAVCLEVAEHLPPWRADALLRILAAAPRVVFSAAHPNQGGRLHVNEQPAEYWIRRFARRGFGVSPADPEFRGAVARLQLAPWYAQNIHVFERPSARLDG